MKRLKRLAAAVLSAALMLSLLAVPAAAAPGSFSDVSDQNTAVNADILRLMGVVSGTGGNRFNPYDTLTRAQFATMAVKFLQRGDEAPRYATRTIFSDVKGGHWARSYINLAASITFEDGENKLPLVSGVGDGRFLPDNEISLAEAVTILARALGYSGKQAGAVWPQGYMDLAATIGLTEGISGGTHDSISRAQAAQLFVNALSCKKADGTVYYKSIGGKLQEKTIILAVNVETDDGSAKGAIRTTSNAASEAYLPAHGEGNPTSLQGKRGDLVLNDRDEILAFVPDDSTAATIVLSGDAQAAYVKASNGQQYTISGDTKLYNSTSAQGQSWLEGYSTLTSGTQITLYSERGKVTAVYATSAATTVDSDAVVVMGSATAATFHQLTGGRTDFTILKNRQRVSLSDLKDYDVVTYDQLSNTLVASDLRLTCVYTDAAPNPKTPLSLKVLGNEFAVLESAWNTIGDVKAGDNVTLLLTADGKVAGVIPASGRATSTAMGTVTDGGAEIFLPNGGTLTLKGPVLNAANMANRLVTISCTKTDITAGRLSTRNAPGPLQVSGMKLGNYTIAAGVRVYEKIKNGIMVPVSLGSLAGGEIPASQIATFHLNSSNMVDYIVLSDVTGNSYQYGMMVASTTNETTRPPVLDENGNPVKDENGNPVYGAPVVSTTTTWKLVRGSGTIVFSSATRYNGNSGDMVGLVTAKDKDGKDYIQDQNVSKLTEIKNVKPSDFFESQGVYHVTVGGRTYRVSDNVECCRGRDIGYPGQETWLTGTGVERLTAIRAYSDNLTIYLDSISQQVRVIACK